MVTIRKVPPFLLLDAWRGLAALWVVMCHSCVPFLGNAENQRFFRFPPYAISIWGQLGVVVFFIISGYCIMGAAHSALAPDRGVGRYVHDRVRRIYPVYLAACSVALILGLLTSVAQSHRLLPPSHDLTDHTHWHQPQFWIANLTLMQRQLGQPSLLFVAWSLCYEVAFYAFIGILLIFARARMCPSVTIGGEAVFQIGISGLTLISLLWLIASPKTCPFPLDRWYQFGLGALLFWVFAAKSAKAIWNARGQLLFAIVLTLLYTLRQSSGPKGLVSDFVLGEPSTGLQAATCLIVIALLWSVHGFDARLAHKPLLRPLMWLGTISYSVYLIHPLATPFLNVGGRRLGFDHENYWVTYLVQITGSIVAGWLFYLLIERHFISARQTQRIKEELKNE